MANEYKSIYTGEEVDESVEISKKALTTDNIVQTTGPSPSQVMSQQAVTVALRTAKAATVQVGTTTTGPAGSNASVTNSGTEYDAILNFTIPQGEQGIQGPAGAGSNPNLLINGDFRVNQRGQSSYRAFANKYCVDRWLTRGNNVTVTPMDYGCSASVSGTGQYYSVLEQIIEDSASLIGKTVTLSANIKSVSADLQIYQYCIRIRSYDVNNELIATSESWITNAGNYSCTLAVPSNTVKVSCLLYKNAVVDCTFEIEYMKLEIGSVATPYSPRPYAEELAMCQRYYQTGRINLSTFSNNTTTLYPNIPLVQTLRTTPTISFPTMPDLRGNGVGANSFIISSLIFNNLQNNSIQLQLVLDDTTPVQANYVYQLLNGMFSSDAEIY